MGERYIMYTVYWAVLLYRPIVHKLISSFPNSFSYGEAALMTQAIILTVTSTLIPHYTDIGYLFHFITKFIHHCMDNMGSTVLLVLWWAVLSVAAIAVVVVYNSHNWEVNTVTRKIFHMAVVLV